MFGAILGDMIGAPYEFDRGEKTKNFPLFSAESEFTDDTVMTIAVAEAQLGTAQPREEDFIRSMQKWGHRYPYAGYGAMFIRWLSQRRPQPYGSFGNGSAMRVSSVGWIYKSLEETRQVARISAKVSHNHPEGIKGAESTASTIFLARIGLPKPKIKEYITEEFGYDLSRTCDEIRPTYRHVETCQSTMPAAFAAFFEGEDYEDVIRNAVSLGGDADTTAAIAGSMAEAYYGIPEDLIDEAVKRLPKDMLTILYAIYTKAAERNRFIGD